MTDINAATNTTINSSSAKILASILGILFINMCHAQDGSPKKSELGGYISYLQTGILDDQWIINNQIHNRINYHFYANKSLTINAALRTRVLYGDYNRIIPEYAKSFESDPGYADLAYVPFSENAWLAVLQSDRLNAEWTRKKLQVTLGRQRINWGQCTVWNPNDIFNAYSFYDFDYIERAGSDAIRLTYYRNWASQIEVAAKLDSENKITAATLYKLNKWNYDIQLFSGVLAEEEYTAGAGTMGYIGANSIRGEVSYLHPVESSADTAGNVLVSIGTDRFCKKDLMLQAEFLYNGFADKIIMENLTNIYSRPSSVKQLSFDKYSVLAGAQYPVTPLINTGLTLMYYVQSDAYFANPSITVSLNPNLDISLIVQYFNLETVQKREEVFMAFWSLKQSF